MKICIYCASSKLIPSSYFQQTAALTALLVENQHHLVYGGGSQGLMGQVADTCLEMGGSITGVIPEFMKKVEWDHKGVSDMQVVQDMTERKQVFFDLADVIIALPGGVGTLEELGEALSLKRLSLIRHPIIIANFDGFYDEFISYLEKMLSQNFMGNEARELWVEIKRPEEIVEAVANAKPWPADRTKTEST